ncbi:DNA repair protein RecN [Prevotella sp. DNF00663]|uniref:DNA repair protein RecN n=1 Tax=unclassified Prevotella TaxID=2638335 RepID=UPI00051406B2|nr:MULTISPECIES: DNA repair protein RecN [unclassified Prevotella]KGI59590.1 DNA recombination protein RecN [Prevotella sp. S7 MS 2]KXB83420.1 DNA repair protein RecN [Prevotella sp. DNF00663]
MLRQLHIKSFTIIKEMSIDFFPGFSVITGETGAGKSIILGAIGLLLGQRADCKSVKPGSNKCIIEAHFDLSGYSLESFFQANDIDYEAQDCIIRREINVTGKSRAFINDTPVPLSITKELGENLLDIHSQHQNLLLQKEDFQLQVIDILANNTKELADYQNSYKQLKALQQQLKELSENIEKDKENQDYLQFRLQELSDANLNDTNEQETLEQEIAQIEHAESIKAAYYKTDDLLSGDDNGIIQHIRNASENLHSIENYHADAKVLAERLDQLHIEVKDIAQEISGKADSIEFDPQLQERLNQRLDTIYSLQQKFHVESIEELMHERDSIATQLNEIGDYDEKLSELNQQIILLEKECNKKALILSKSRARASKLTEEEMHTRLIPMGIPNIKFEVSIKQKELSSDGCDKVSFLFSANKNTPLQPISQVASGGEIARVMFSLKAMISGAIKLPTIIFDEVDTGISGRVAEQMAKIMNEMGMNGRQVISITHLPQIAALGTHHYKVSKNDTEEETESRMILLSDEERVQEIAQMLSGSSVTKEAISNARALLDHKTTK